MRTIVNKNERTFSSLLDEALISALTMLMVAPYWKGGTHKFGLNPVSDLASNRQVVQH